MGLSKIFVIADAAFCVSLLDQFAHAGDTASIEAASPNQLAGDADAFLIDASFIAPAPIVAALRRGGFSNPIILIGDSRQPPCPGADAALTRPLRFTELRAALTRAEPRVGRYSLKGQSLVATGDCRDALRLTEKEAAILTRLARASGRPVSRDTLLRDVWGYGPNLTTRALEAQVYRLRRKLEQDSRQPRILLTTRAGYRLATDDWSPRGAGVPERSERL